MPLTNFIKSKTIELGFQKVGIAPANATLNNSEYLDEWLASGKHGTMNWLERRNEERQDIHKYFPEVESIVSVAMNYFTDDIKTELKFSRYAHGEDYHTIVKDKLLALLKAIQSQYSQPIKGLACVDSSPVMEKHWAQQAGLGWQGKHTILINKEYGSWMFLGELLLDIELDYDNPFTTDLCGSCIACVDACPTNALKDYQLDATKCISYLTVEYKDKFDKLQENQLNGWIYGCDICQQVCPWNHKLQQESVEPAFQSIQEIRDCDINCWNRLKEETFHKIFAKSGIKRIKYRRLKRNISAVTSRTTSID